MPAQVNSIAPYWGNVVVLLDTPDEATLGGIILPEPARPQKIIGTIKAIGPGRIDNKGKHHVPKYKVGDRVVIGQHLGYKVHVRGVEYKMMEERHIVCHLKPAQVKEVPRAETWVENGYEWKHVANRGMVSTSLQALVETANRVQHSDISSARLAEEFAQGWEIGSSVEYENSVKIITLKRKIWAQ